MKVFPVTDKAAIAPLFEGWQETMIWSCLQDRMGTAYADDLKHPRSAKIVIADFCFFAGIPNEDLVGHRPGEAGAFLIMVPQHEGWSQIIEAVYGANAVRRERFATKKEPDVFDRETLVRYSKQVPQAYEIRRIDEELFLQIRVLGWAQDLCSQFADYSDYASRGIGVAALRDGVVVSGASSYTVYRDGIEIEIDTREDERRKGLALACGARLILECLDCGRYPSWDAHNKGSLALAEKLGYHPDGTYPVYEVTGGSWQRADKRYQAVIYDLDGTILNTLDMNMYPLIQIIREETGEEWTFEEVLRFAPYPGMKVMEELGVADKEKTYARWVRYVNEYETGAALYDGVSEVLEQLHGRFRQAVASAKTREQYEIDFASKGLERYIETAVLADDTIRHKPDPEPLLLCLARLGVPAREALYVGDSPSDYHAALSAGMDFGYARWGSINGEGINHPAYVFEKPADLLRLAD